MWSDATVKEAINDGNLHRLAITGVDEECLMLLNSLNHSLLRLSSADYDDALRKYRAFTQSRYGFIADALTGERLSIDDQVIKLTVLDATAGGRADSDTSGYDRLAAMTQPRDDRNFGVRDVRRVLIEAEAAAGKTVMMRQVIHQCCKWDHRDKNDTVPILVLVIDLQRSMKKHVDHYEDADDLIAVYLRLNHFNDPLRFGALMQASCERKQP